MLIYAGMSELFLSLLIRKVFQYCTCNNVMMPSNVIKERRFVSGNELLGERLYQKLQDFYDNYLSQITSVCTLFLYCINFTLV